MVSSIYISVDDQGFADVSVLGFEPGSRVCVERCLNGAIILRPLESDSSVVPVPVAAKEAEQESSQAQKDIESSPEAMAAIKAGLDDVKAGRFVPRPQRPS